MRFIACCRDTMYQMDIAYVPSKNRWRGPTRPTHGFMVDIYIHIYTYICILNYIKYICTMVGWDSTTNLFIYIYRIYMRSFYPRPKKKPVRWAITTITTNISYTMLYVMSSILHHLTHNVIMCYVYIYIWSLIDSSNSGYIHHYIRFISYRFKVYISFTLSHYYLLIHDKYCKPLVP